MSEKPHGAGRSSFDLVDSGAVFERIIVRPDTVLLDLGCGAGNYSLAAAGRMGTSFRVIGMDLWLEGVKALREAAKSRGHDNVLAVQADAARPLPLAGDSVDAVLMATVFHDLVQGGAHEAALGEIARVLRPAGRLAVVEFKVVEGPPGPPASVRIGPDKLAGMFAAAGFVQRGSIDAGEFTYLSVFSSK